MRSVPLYNLKQGINRLRVKGGANPSSLYDLVNAWITVDGSIKPREGTIRAQTLTSSTKGLMADNGVFNVFSITQIAVPSGYVDNLLINPNDATQAIKTIWFAKPFMGFPYVVAEFANGDVFHYWLQDSGVWAPNTVYNTGTLILPLTNPTGLAYLATRVSPVNPTWQPETSIVLGTIVEPTEYTGFQYEAVAIAGQQQGMLLHMDGTAASTSFPDSGGYNIATTAHGTAAVETSAVKFGTGALALDGSTAYVTAPVVQGGPIDIGLGDFTIECWIKPSNLNAGVPFCIANTTGAATTLVTVSIGGAGTGTMAARIFGATPAAGNTGLSSGAFHHIALTAAGTTGHLFVDGIEVVGTSPFTIGAGRVVMNGATLSIGAVDNSAGPSAFMAGDLDEFRITKGTALYTAAFTPPVAPFTASVQSIGAHTGATEPVWPIVSAATIQEFGDFDTSATDAGTTQGTTPSTAQPLSSTITDRYGDSSTIANAGAASGAATTIPPVASTQVTTWAPGTLYAPGAVVQPTTTQGAFINAIPNGDFENGNDGNWVLSAGVSFNNTNQYQGNDCLQFTASHSDETAVMSSFGVVTPGQNVTATCYVNPNNAGANLSMGIDLRWYDVNDVFLSLTAGPREEGGGYRLTSVTGVAPSNAVHCRVQIDGGNNTSSHTGFADLVSWNLATPAAVSNFLFEAVQAAAGASASTQPVWPTVADATVVDNQVTWKAIGTSIITWEAIPIMQSGPTEPTWPTAVPIAVLDASTFTDVNGAVINTSISWVANSRQITDPKCPDTISVALGASHVFAIDKDIVDFSAAVDPTDWSSANNAGYLPTGLNNYGDNPAMVLALYRSNLMAFNAGGYQMWQIDPDPANMALLDAQPVGSIYTRAAQSVSNDLLFLTEVGVRNLATVGATANMQVGSSGQPVDPIVVTQLQAGTFVPLSLYYPGKGQYWLFFGPQAFVFTVNGQGLRTWSRYIFPDTITDWTLNGGILYLRTAGDLVWQFDANTLVDDAGGANTVFNGVIQSPYVDAGPLGFDKELIGVDLVGDGTGVIIQIGWAQNDPTTFNDNPGFSASLNVTPPFTVNTADTVPGQPIPFPMTAPSFTLILTFPGNQAWEWNASSLYLQDQSGTPTG